MFAVDKLEGVSAAPLLSSDIYICIKHWIVDFVIAETSLIPDVLKDSILTTNIMDNSWILRKPCLFRLWSNDINRFLANIY